MSTATHPDREVPARTRGGLMLDRWDLGFFAAVLVILVGSVVPLGTLRQNLWTTPGVFFLGVGVVLPLVAAGLVLARGVSGLEGPRVGSLSTAQFAHVASWLALAYFFSSFVTVLHPVFLIGLLGAFGMVLTSPLRGLMARALASSADRRSRPAAVGTAGTPEASEGPTPAPQAAATAPAAFVTPAAAAAQHREATPARGPAPLAESGQPSGAEIDEDLGMTRLRPRTTEEAEASATAAFGAPGTDHVESTQATAEPAVTAEPAPAEEPAPEGAALAGEPVTPRGTEPAGYEAFWFAVGSPRSTVNPEDGSPAFGLEPGGWILALEDRGHEFLVQNTDGRTGVLRDLSDIERA
ncbi:MAG: hypothetical protein QJR09_11135 [Micrococcus sp.]|nr:hypothetical protein [Micrococcus sp.]